MNRYKVGPQQGRCLEVDANSPEQAYRALCCWYDPSIPVIVTDLQTGRSEAYTRALDSSGNLEAVRRVNV